MRQREQDLESCGNPFEDLTRYDNCAEAIKWGLSERVYLNRNAKSEAECQLSTEERKTLSDTRRSLSSQLSFVPRQETCVRNIMLGRQ
jgi:hypothetical protein